MRRNRFDKSHSSQFSLPTSVASRISDSARNPEMLRIISTLPFSTNGYSFEEVIGSGSFGVVFKVYHSGYKREFAAKMIAFRSAAVDKNQETESSFESEISLLIRLLHPNIIKIYDSFRYLNKFVMIFQYCSNGTLKSLIQTGNGLTKDLQIPFMKQMVSALCYLHEHQVAHLDIKTANVFIDNFMRPLLADFGLSLHLDNSEQINSFAGSFIYRSPEMIQQLPYDPFKADVWALGVTFFLMVTGREPWPMYNIDMMKQAIIEGKYEITEIVDTKIVDVIRSMLMVDPKERPSIMEISEMPLFKNKEPPRKTTLVRRKEQDNKIKHHLSFNRSLKLKTTSDSNFNKPAILTNSTDNFTKGSTLLIL